MLKPLVSICCMTYNHEKYIQQCLNGFVMQQTNFAFEILVHEDASTDNTASIVKEYEAKYPDLFRCVYQTENQFYLQNALTNILFPMCKGKFIALCEGDDYWTDPYKLQQQVDFLEANTNYGLIHSAYLNCNEKGEKSNPFLSGQTDLKGQVFEKLLIQNRIGTLTVVARKSLLIDAIKYYQLNKNNVPLYDIFLWLYCSLNSKVAFLEDVTAVYRKVIGSASYPIDPVNKARFLVDISKIEMFYATNHLVSQNVKETVRIKADKRELYLNFLIKNRRGFFNNLFNLLKLRSVSKKDLIFTVGSLIPFVYKIILKKVNSIY